MRDSFQLLCKYSGQKICAQRNSEFKSQNKCVWPVILDKEF